MTTQPLLFGPGAESHHRQGDLFAGHGVTAWGVRCDQCGVDLLETANYLICPKCLAKLIPDVPDSERSGSWFDAEEAEL